MATISAVILKDQKKNDRTWNVKFRIGHKGSSSYMDTDYFVSKSQLNSKYKIKDPFIINQLDDDLTKHRKNILTIRGELDNLTAIELRLRLENMLKVKQVNSPSEINFIEFCRQHIGQLEAEGKTGSTPTLKTVVYSLVDYFKTDIVFITDITSNFLFEYERYLRAPRKLTRLNQGKNHDYTKTGLGRAGLHNHMRDLRLLFNACRNKYNDEDLGVIQIKHYPFKKYKVGSAPQTQSRALGIDQICKIYQLQAEPGSRLELARDLFMLSSFLCGMNAADLFELSTNSYKLKRIEYKRAKTRNKRKDEAFISILNIQQSKPLLKKYAGKLQDRYSSTASLNAALNKGINAIGKELGFDFDFYSARHSFGSLARNSCRFPKDDIAIAMNHVEDTVTDIYIKKDWSIIDEVQAGVVALFISQLSKPDIEDPSPVV